MPRYKIVLCRPTYEYAEVELLALSAADAEARAPKQRNLQWAGDEAAPTADDINVLSCEEITEPTTLGVE